MTSSMTSTATSTHRTLAAGEKETQAKSKETGKTKDAAKSKPDNKEVSKAFAEAVNMSPSELKHWLDQAESKKVGWPPNRGGKESVGHKSGRRIVEIKAKSKSELDASDLTHMAKVVSYVKRHLAQRPIGDVSETKWRYSLMNWGHDPLKS